MRRARRQLCQFYFCFFLASGSYFPYASLYYRSLHLSGGQIGWLFAVSPLVAIPLQPVWGIFSDRFGWRRHILRIALFTSALLAPLVTRADGFLPVMGIVALLAIGLSPVTPLADTTTLQYLQGDAALSFGQIRMWGSGGFLIAALVAGQIYNVWGIGTLFPLYGVLLGLAGICSLFLPYYVPHHHEPGGLSHTLVATTPDRQGAWSLLRGTGLGVFYAVALLGYSATSAYNGFFSLYLNKLGADTGVVGLASALSALSEVPVMYVSGRLIARWGPRRVIMGGTAVAALRWTFLAQVRFAPLAVASQLVHGLTFATFYTGGVTYADRHSPTALRATSQTLFNAATFGLGVILGSITFGWLFDRIGVFSMFLVAGAMSGATAILLTVVVRD